jgi:hypothetical protein
MLSYEEAIMARQNLIKENQSKVAEIKEEVSWKAATKRAQAAFIHVFFFITFRRKK